MRAPSPHTPYTVFILESRTERPTATKARPLRAPRRSESGEDGRCYGSEPFGTLSEVRGRPRKFCSVRCRRDFGYEREKEQLEQRRADERERRRERLYGRLIERSWSTSRIASRPGTERCVPATSPTTTAAKRRHRIQATSARD